MDFLANEYKNLEGDFKSAYDYTKNNWKRILGWAATYYVGTHYGPTGMAKAQAILKVLGM